MMFVRKLATSVLRTTGCSSSSSSSAAATTAFAGRISSVHSVSLRDKTSMILPSILRQTLVVPLVGTSFRSLCTQTISHQSSLLQSIRICQSNGLMLPFVGQRSYHLCLQMPKINTSLLRPMTESSTLGGKELTRSVVKFSMKKGRRKTVRAVIKRFYRLDWGIWIHAKSGRGKHLWKKGKLQKKRSRQHVFCNAWHTRTLERMTTKYWHKKKYWVNDPYESYHSRPDFWVTKNTKNIIHQLD